MGSALLRRKRLLISYFSRGTRRAAEREVSPQRLVHYRENWYLDAWCHLRKGLRNFCGRFDPPRRDPGKAGPRSHRSGPSTRARPGLRHLRRTRSSTGPSCASRLSARAGCATEFWHPRQRGSFEADGSYVLEVPYADHRELLMDILKFGADVEVLGPDELRRIVGDEVQRLRALYK